MKIKAFNTAVAALSLVFAPTMAAAQPIATPLTQQQQPASETVTGDNALGGGVSFIVGALAIVLIGLAIYIAVDEDTSPNSP